MWEASEGRRPAEPARGALCEAPAEGPKRSVRLLPARSLASHVHHIWSVRWALERTLLTEGLLYPTVRIVFVQTARVWRAEIAGPRTERLTKLLEGEGQVFGIAFRPAAFAPLLDERVALITDRVLPLHAVFGKQGDAWAASVLEQPDLDQRVALATAFLEPRLAPLSLEVRRIRDVVEQMARDRSLRRVEDVCEASGLELRTLQRGFRRFVGVSPKWALQGFRMQEAVERLKAEDAPPLAELAASLDYADQAHFSRDFKRRVGETPRRFVERIRRDRRRHQRPGDV